mgnify:CR=1 FL=1
MKVMFSLLKSGGKTNHSYFFAIADSELGQKRCMIRMEFTFSLGSGFFW